MSQYVLPYYVSKFTMISHMLALLGWWFAKASEEAPKACWMQVSDTEGHLREYACGGLPAEVPYGEPFVIRDGNESCKRIARGLRERCSLSSTFAESREVSPSFSPFPQVKSVGDGCADDGSKSLEMKARWNLYRLTDVTRAFCGLRPLKCTTSCTFDHFKLPVGSLGRQISSLCLTHNLSWVESVKVSVNRRIVCGQESGPPPGSVVVHLRVGDVVDASNYTVRQLLSKERPFYAWSPLSLYVRPFSFFESHIDTDFLKNRTVVLVAGATAGANTTAIPPRPIKSCLYVRSLRAYFMVRGAREVILRLGRSPDDDIAYMSQADYFLPSGGGYSRIPAFFVQKRGGTVLQTQRELQSHDWWHGYFNARETAGERSLDDLTTNVIEPHHPVHHCQSASQNVGGAGSTVKWTSSQR